MSDSAPGRTRRKPAPSDVIGTAIMGAVGAVAVIMGLGYGFFQDDGQVGPGFLPVTTGGFIVVASLVEIARMYLAKSDGGGALLSAAEAAEEEAKAAAARAEQGEEELDTFGRTARQRNLALIKIFGLLFVALLLIPVIGMLLSLTAMVLAIILWVERKPLVPALLTTLGVLGLAYVVFVQLLGVPVPEGMLGLI